MSTDFTSVVLSLFGFYLNKVLLKFKFCMVINDNIPSMILLLEFLIHLGATATLWVSNTVAH
jgi:hypothetical protein